VPKMVWRVKLVAELQAGEPTEVELARFERDEQTGLAGLGLRLAEAKQLESMQSCGVCSDLGKFWAHEARVGWCRRWPLPASASRTMTKQLNAAA
jgi:hypothetical protein